MKKAEEWNSTAGKLSTTDLKPFDGFIKMSGPICFETKSEISRDNLELINESQNSDKIRTFVKFVVKICGCVLLP